MSYTRVIPVEFNHCDPAGIVFYPRYFEMVNSVVETFFADVLGASFAQIHVVDGCGVPTARIAATFHAPSRLGDRVAFSLGVRKVGRASADFRIAGTMGDEARLTVDLTIVWIDQSGKASPWPQALRMALEGAA